MNQGRNGAEVARDLVVGEQGWRPGAIHQLRAREATAEKKNKGGKGLWNVEFISTQSKMLSLCQSSNFISIDILTLKWLGSHHAV